MLNARSLIAMILAVSSALFINPTKCLTIKMNKYPVISFGIKPLNYTYR